MRGRGTAIQRIMNWLVILLALDGLAFVMATVLTPITRQQVTTGAIVVYGAVAFSLAGLLLIVGLGLILGAFIGKSPVRRRILGAYCVGVVGFAGCVLLVGQWIALRMP